MLNSQSRQIGTYTYIVTQMPGREAFRMFTRLTKLLGPALAELTGKAGQDVNALLGADVSSLGPAIVALCDGLDVRDLDVVLDEFAKHARVKGGQIQGDAPMGEMFDVVFAGHPLDVLKWLAFCIEVNFSDFFVGLSPAPASSGEAAAAPSSK